MPIVIDAGASTAFKPCFAPSENVGLCVRCNGEQAVAVIDPFGFLTPAGIAPPFAAATCAPGPVGGQMNVGKWVVYTYVYAAKDRFPFVEADSVGGNLYPRSNPSTLVAAPFQVTDTGSCDVSVTYTSATSTDGQTGTPVDRIWVARTIDFDNADDAKAAALAGDFYYVDELVVPPSTPPGTVFVYHDSYQTPTDDQIEYDNYLAPQFQYCVYADPYWWGFGNFQRKVAASWTADGLVTFNDPTFNFYDGRYNQPVYLTPQDADDNSVGSGNRLYYAYPTTGNSGTQCQLIRDSDTPTDHPVLTPGSGYIIFAGPSTTLYRSKFRNPMAWGQTVYVGDIRVPEQFFFKVGGGTGTGIAQVPNTPLLVLSTKGPARTYTLDLRTAGTDQFTASLKCISTLYSTSSHFAQFSAVTSQGQMVLWGWDADNKCITACDGNSIVPISDNVSNTMRALSIDKDLQRMAHGLYDPDTQLNCLWVPSLNATDTMDVLLMQYAPSGKWFKQFEGDVLASAIVQGNFCSLRAVYLGTQAGHFGIGLDSTKTRNWLFESLTLSGKYSETSQLQSPVLPSSVGLIGTWMLLLNNLNSGDQWGRLSDMSADGLTPYVDKVWSPTLGWGATWFRNPQPGDPYYLSVIEVSLVRYFDMGMFAEDKALQELWLAMDGVDQNNPTVFQYFRDRLTNPLILPGGPTTLGVNQIKYDDGQMSQQWGTETPPTERVKVFGLRILDRGYGFWRMFGFGGKYTK